MRTMLIALGNPLRRDDGVAHAALDLMKDSADFVARHISQLTPEIAADFARYDAVVFLDADVGAKEILIEPVENAPSNAPITHVSRPEFVVTLSRGLFRFAGRVFLMHIPAVDFSLGEGLSRRAAISARRAAAALECFCTGSNPAAFLRSHACAPSC
jgi:Ni,Fe-hydrogenase maturation factor